MSKEIDKMGDDEILEYLNSLDESIEDDFIKQEETKLKEHTNENLSKRLSAKKDKRIVDRRTKVFQIKNSYISNNRTHELYKELDKSILTEIIEIKTKSLQTTVDNCKNYVTKKIEYSLNTRIPTALKIVYKKYGRSFVKHPGFEYTASEVYGGGKIWVVPNIPYYFDQFTEVDIINRYFIGIKHLLDKSVQSYHMNVNKLLKIESKLAIKLARIKTLIGLLETDVDIYELYIEVRDRRINEAKQVNLKKQEDRLDIERYGHPIQK